MKNNTKVRLHLSKQLFESLASQVLAEAKGKKNFGAGMEEVKAPKGEKKAKDQEPEKKEDSVKEVSGRPGLPKAPGLNISKNATPNIVYSKQDLKVKFMELARQLNLMKGLDNAETSAIGRLIDDIIAKLKDGTVANQINIAGKAFKNATKNIKTSVKKEGIEEIETEIAEGIDPEFLRSFIESLAIIGSVIGGGSVALTKYMKGVAKKAMEAHPEKFPGLDPNNPEDVKKVEKQLGSATTSAMQKTVGGTGGAGIGGQSSKA